MPWNLCLLWGLQFSWPLWHPALAPAPVDWHDTAAARVYGWETATLPCAPHAGPTLGCHGVTGRMRLATQNFSVDQKHWWTPQDVPSHLLLNVWGVDWNSLMLTAYNGIWWTYLLLISWTPFSYKPLFPHGFGLSVMGFMHWSWMGWSWLDLPCSSIVFFNCMSRMCVQAHQMGTCDWGTYPLVIGSDTILWSWSADRIPQTPITVGSPDWENTNCELNRVINYSLGNLELKLRDRGWIKNIRLMTYIHNVTIGGVAT